MNELFNFLLKNCKVVDWRRFKSNLTIFDTPVDVNREDVLVGILLKNEPASAPPAEGLNTTFSVEALKNEPLPTASLSLIIIIPEEFDKYDLEMFRKGHTPQFRLK